MPPACLDGIDVVAWSIGTGALCIFSILVIIGAGAILLYCALEGCAVLARWYAKAIAQGKE